MPTALLDRFLSEVYPPTPFIVLDLDIVRAHYAALRQAVPAAAIYYAVKANPATGIIAALAALGASSISQAPANSTFETRRRQGAGPRCEPSAQNEDAR